MNPEVWDNAMDTENRFPLPKSISEESTILIL